MKNYALVRWWHQHSFLRCCLGSYRRLAKLNCFWCSQVFLSSEISPGNVVVVAELFAKCHKTITRLLRVLSYRPARKFHSIRTWANLFTEKSFNLASGDTFKLSKLKALLNENLLKVLF